MWPFRPLLPRGRAGSPEVIWPGPLSGALIPAPLPRRPADWVRRPAGQAGRRVLPPSPSPSPSPPPPLSLRRRTRAFSMPPCVLSTRSRALTRGREWLPLQEAPARERRREATGETRDPGWKECFVLKRSLSDEAVLASDNRQSWRGTPSVDTSVKATATSDHVDRPDALRVEEAVGKVHLPDRVEPPWSAEATSKTGLAVRTAALGGWVPGGLPCRRAHACTRARAHTRTRAPAHPQTRAPAQTLARAHPRRCAHPRTRWDGSACAPGGEDVAHPVPHCSCSHSCSSMATPWEASASETQLARGCAWEEAAPDHLLRRSSPCLPQTSASPWGVAHSTFAQGPPDVPFLPACAGARSIGSRPPPMDPSPKRASWPTPQGHRRAWRVPQATPQTPPSRPGPGQRVLAAGARPVPSRSGGGGGAGGAGVTRQCCLSPRFAGHGQKILFVKVPGFGLQVTACFGRLNVSATPPPRAGPTGGGRGAACRCEPCRRRSRPAGRGTRLTARPSCDGILAA